MGDAVVISGSSVFVALAALYALTLVVTFLMVLRSSLPLVRSIWVGWLLVAGANAFIAWGATGLLLYALVLSLAPLVVWSICGVVIYLCSIIRPRGSAPYGADPEACEANGIGAIYRDCLSLLAPLPRER